MNRKEVRDKLSLIFKEILDDENIVLNEDMNFSDIEGQDSFSHVALLSSIEDDFGVKISLKQMLSMSKISDLIDLILELKK